MARILGGLLSRYHGRSRLPERAEGSGFCAGRLKRADLEVPEGDGAAVILQEQRALGLLDEAREAGVLRLLDERAELRAAELVFDDLDAVEPVFDVVAADEQAGLVELAGGAKGFVGGS